MIVVFVIDTSPSMALPANHGEGSEAAKSHIDVHPSSRSTQLSRLDVAKMAVESLTKGLDRRVLEYNRQLVLEVTPGCRSWTACPLDQFLLLSTSRQYRDQPGTVACGAGGRLLIGYGDSFVHNSYPQTRSGDPAGRSNQNRLQYSHDHGGFQRELKRLKPTVIPKSERKGETLPFPEDGGGAVGLNAAVSAGLQLLHRYRLRFRSTENFGMGRLLTVASTHTPSESSNAGDGGGKSYSSVLTGVGSSLQPACLILLTDGECLSKPISEGGGELQLQFGNMPLREFYREPFRWDQRFFCLQIGGERSLASSLRALCEVTGGGAFALRGENITLGTITEAILRRIAPPFSRLMPMVDPLGLPGRPSEQHQVMSASFSTKVFINGGPVCSLQVLEIGSNGEPGPICRVMLLHVPYTSSMSGLSSNDVILKGKRKVPSSPIWCIPESYWPSKKLDSLPQRLAQPLLSYSRQYHVFGSNTFDPMTVISAVHRLDQLLTSTRGGDLSAGSGIFEVSKEGTNNNVQLLQRDVYGCEWLCKIGDIPQSTQGYEHFPLCVRGAGHPSLSEREDQAENLLHIGILHVPPSTSSRDYDLKGQTEKASTITLLPPDPHILLPLLVRAAEAEYRMLKKEGSTGGGNSSSTQGTIGATAGILQKQAGGANRLPSSSAGARTPRAVYLDENWKTEFRAYLMRIPPYYQGALRRALRPILPPSTHSLLNNEGVEVIASHCFSRSCLQKIRNGEQLAREINEKLEKQEEEFRLRCVQPITTHQESQDNHQSRSNQNQHKRSNNIGDSRSPANLVVEYGQYDSRTSVSSYLAALRHLPAPWRLALLKSKEKSKRIEPHTAVGIAKQDPQAISIKPIPTQHDSSFPIDSEIRNVTETLGELPAECLLAYYETRRRWTFGGSGLTTKSLSVEGVSQQGCSVHRCDSAFSIQDECLLSVAGVGASMTNDQTVQKMGDYRERLLWARSPIVGYGRNDSTGIAATTLLDGSTAWSVDDDVMPSSFFDPKSGNFLDSAEARIASRLQVNFGNPFHDQRGNSVVPEMYHHLRPPKTQPVPECQESGPRTPPTSPPHDSFLSPVEGEGEAAFAGTKHQISSSRKVVDGFDSDRSRSKIPLLFNRPKRHKGETHAQKEIVLDKASILDTTEHNVDSRERSSSSPSHAAIQLGEENVIDDKSAIEPLHQKRNTKPVGQHPLNAIHKPLRTQHKPPPPPPLSKKSMLPKQKSSVEAQILSRKPPPPPPLQQEYKAQTDHAPTSHMLPLPIGQKVQSEIHPSRKPPTSSLSAEVQSPYDKPKVQLPPNWMCVWSKSQKRWYFFDRKTNKSIWEWPSTGDPP